ncbi:hypothetical protein ACFCXS_35190 [Streptomyces sp. NPDC056373]|uniref:hypothetical protein n=1 Tax=Streptomyces sp. NPDC056373 TaxID=3345798 RepID=UPI0035D5FF4F
MTAHDFGGRVDLRAHLLHGTHHRRLAPAPHEALVRENHQDRTKSDAVIASIVCES